jgi:hypothetical protein
MAIDHLWQVVGQHGKQFESDTDAHGGIRRP